MDDFDVVEYLLSKDIEVRPAGPNEVHMACWECGEDPTKKGRLYVHSTRDESYGLWSCFLCNARGNLNSIRRHFGDAPIDLKFEGSGNPHPLSDQSRRILSAAARFYHEALLQNREAWFYLTEERGLTEETIKRFGLGYAEGTGLITHLVSQKGFGVEEIRETGLVGKFGDDLFYTPRIIIPYRVMGQTVMLKGRDLGGHSDAKYLGTGPARLFNEDATLGTDRVTVCEGEMDTISASQLGFDAVGVPGAGVWKQEWSERLIDKKRIYLIYDNDVEGRNGAEKRAEELGSRSRVVSMPETLPGQKKLDVNQWVVQGKTKEDLEALMAKAPGGMLITPMQAHEKWDEWENGTKDRRLRLNVQALDRAMDKGIGPAQVVIPVSRTGSGKTLSMLNIFHRMSLIKPDIKLLLITLEQMSNEWFEYAHRIHTFYDPAATPIDTARYWADKLFIVDKNRLTPEQMREVIEQVRFERDDLDMVGVDYLQYLARGYRGEATERTGAAIHDLKALAKDQEIAIWVPSQSGRKGEYGEEMHAGAAKDSGTVEETADVEISLWNENQREGVSVAEHTNMVHMKIQKVRGSGLHAQADFLFSPLSLAMVPTDDPLVRKVEREIAWFGAGVSWREAQQRHRSGDYSAFSFVE